MSVHTEPARVVVEPTRSQWRIIVRRFLRHRLALAGSVVLLVLMICCFGASIVAPYPENTQDLLLGPVNPGTDGHLLGTDNLGRDFLFLIVPGVAIVALALQGLGSSSLTIIVVLSALGWTSIARVARSQVISLREKEFIEACRVIGASTPRILVRHMLPNLAGLIATSRRRSPTRSSSSPRCAFRASACSRPLLSAVPVPDPVIERTRERILLTGSVPNPAERLPLPHTVLEGDRRMRDGPPPLDDVSATHAVACHHPEPRTIV